MRILLALGGPLVVALLTIAACRGDGEEAPESLPSPTSTESTLTVDGLELRLQIDKPAYRPGEPIHISLIVTNTSHAAVSLFFVSGQRYDFLVSCSPLPFDECPTWRWSLDKVFTQALGQETLAPGRSLTYEETWDQRDQDGRPVPPDTYAIVARIVGCYGAGTRNCGLEVGPVTFDISP